MTPTDTETVHVRAHNRSVKRLGDWTTARRFDVRASRGLVVLDLMLPRIAPGVIDIALDIDHATVKLLVPDGAIIDDGDLRRVGRGRVKDWTGASAPDGRRIRLGGEIRNAEVRVHRGGVAILSLLRSRRSLQPSPEGPPRRPPQPGGLTWPQRPAPPCLAVAPPIPSVGGQAGVGPHHRRPRARTYGDGRNEMQVVVDIHGASVAMTEHAVVIAGGGPTGMMLAAELALAGVDVALLERRADHVLAGSRAGGFHSRTIEVLDQRGVADRFLAEGQVVQAATFGTTMLDMSDFPTRHPYSLGIWQNQIERIMAEWIAELPVHIRYGCEVTGFAQDDTGVDVRLSGGESLRARYLVGCDGGRSLIRKAAGIEFPGWDATRSNLIAEVEMTEEPELGIRHDEKGTHALGRLEYEIRDGEVVYADEGPVRVMVTEAHVGHTTEPTLRDLRDALISVYGTDFGMHNPTSISRFTDMTRQAAAYRAGRVLLAGDAAHVHYPVGGQGLSLGVQDAVNLGWKLAQVVGGTSPESLLDTYHAERHPVAARVLRYTMAQGDAPAP